MAIWKRIRKYRNMDTSEKEAEIAENVEKGDFFAMWLAAIKVLWIPTALVILAFAGILLLIFTVLL